MGLVEVLLWSNASWELSSTFEGIISNFIFYSRKYDDESDDESDYGKRRNLENERKK